MIPVHERRRTLAPGLERRFTPLAARGGDAGRAAPGPVLAARRAGGLGGRPRSPDGRDACRSDRGDAHGNLLRALVGFGWLDDERVQAAVDWQAGSVTGEGYDTWNRWATSRPGFACGINGGLPCAWGAIKALRGPGRHPAGPADAARAPGDRPRGRVPALARPRRGRQPDPEQGEPELVQPRLPVRPRAASGQDGLTTGMPYHAAAPARRWS